MRFHAAFDDEMQKLGGILRPTPDRLIGRMTAAGALAGGGAYAARKGLSSVGIGTDPGAGGDSLISSAGKTAAGGALVALLLKALGKATGKR